MPRVKPITSKDDLAPEYHAFFDKLQEGRTGPFGGPQSILLLSPEVSQRATHLTNYLRYESVIAPKDIELATLAIAREKDCFYVWGAHASPARKAGVREEAIAIIRDRRDPAQLQPDERDIVLYVQQLLECNRVDQPVFDRLLQAHGRQWLVELTALIGQYGLLAGALNAFEVPEAEGAEHLPVPALDPAAVEQEVRQLQRERMAAMVKGDFDALNRIMADDMTYTHTTARNDTKQSLIDSIREGRVRYAAFDPTEAALRLYHDSAVITGKARVHAISANGDNQFGIQFTEVFQRRNHRWQSVAWQSTRLPD